MKILNSAIDSILNVPYLLVEIDNAKKLSDTLKKTLEKRGIDYSKFNSGSKSYSWNAKLSKMVEKDPPREIYEYQPFCFMEDEKETLYLMDGFRRLLWYNTPEVSVCARIYKRKDLTDSQLLQLLVYLNHFKFYGGGDYEERGFALLLHTLFDISLFGFREAFDGYLSSNKVKRTLGGDYGVEEEKNDRVKSRIVTDRFIPDMRFLQDLRKEDSCNTSEFGAMVYNTGATTEVLYDAKTFKKLSLENKVLGDLLVKYNKMAHDSRRHTVYNNILDQYQNILNHMSGKEVKKTYAEILAEAKGWSEELKKDKRYTKITGIKNQYQVDYFLAKAFEEGRDIKFKLVIYPQKEKENEYYGLHHEKDKTEYLSAQVRDDVKILKVPRSSHYSDKGHPYPEIGFSIGNKKYLVGRRFINKDRYNELELKDVYPNRERYNIDLFMEVTKEEFKAFDWRA